MLTLIPNEDAHPSTEKVSFLICEIKIKHRAKDAKKRREEEEGEEQKRRYIFRYIKQFQS